MKASQREIRKQQERFATYLDQVTQVAGHADRVEPMQDYTKGVLLPIERKSVEPMAARLAPDNVRQMHQSLHHIVAQAAWSDTALLSQVRSLV
ncbi:MAG: IS701 family transposase, partial [Candidatus Angelobacter sp. Gp1-AA117]